MKHFFLSVFALFLTATVATAQNQLDRYVFFPNSNQLVELVAGAGDISSPVDLDFHPDTANRPNELWVLNQGTNATGGNTVIFTDAHSNSPSAQLVKDGNSWHFMALSSSLAFGENGNWATAQDILDANRSNNLFTGPTLWSSDLMVYGTVGNPPTFSKNGSYIDAVHQSPYGKGIAWESDNVYWIMDGYDGTLKRYDFKKLNNPGEVGDFDADVRIYSDFSFTRNSDLPAHIVMDDDGKWLYGCDTEGKRVFRVDITTGKFNKALTPLTAEPLDLYQEYLGLTEETVLDTALSQPVGIDIHGDRMIISDHQTGKIILFDLTNMEELGKISFPTLSNPGIKGVKFGPDGNIYFVDDNNDKVYRLENDKEIDRCFFFHRAGIEIFADLGKKELYTNLSDAKYQWLECLDNDAYTEVDGEVDSVFQPTRNGSYALRAEVDGCVDTSECTNIIVIGMAEALDQSWTFYPNPASQFLVVATQGREGSLELVSLSGAVLRQKSIRGDKVSFNMESLPSGLYYLKFRSSDFVDVKKVLKR